MKRNDICNRMNTKGGKRLLKKSFAIAICGSILLGTGVQGVMAADGVVATPYVCLGADLAPEQKATVLSLLDLTEDDLQNYTVMEITNAQEHQYLDAYLSADIIGDQAWSSAKILAKEDGHGITVSTQNINYCTASMYENALATAGVADAEILVAGPVPISGTAALIGIMNAYADMNDEKLNSANVDAATDELVTTSKLGEAIGDQEKASELIAAVKEAVAESGIADEKKASELIDEAADELKITLNEEEKNMILSLLRKISQLDLDVNKLREQAKGIYDKLGTMDIHLNKEEVKGILGKIGDVFARIWEALIGLFNKL